MSRCDQKTEIQLLELFSYFNMLKRGLPTDAPYDPYGRNQETSRGWQRSNPIYQRSISFKDVIKYSARCLQPDSNPYASESRSPMKLQMGKGISSFAALLEDPSGDNCNRSPKEHLAH
ncbi:hypothetical protein CEXT_626841 [Caerostris extrusa]|uniref:Uncharacterized protein n=1 Tax=Caerostris extrusa TaxID=172846 RepID=A0AAV4MJN4_CAEEX|nr:hypothetical protein CEXT_626841 [Caerostris extrusa]